MEELVYTTSFTIFETTRATVEYFAFETTSGFVPPLIVLLSSALKLAVALFCRSRFGPLSPSRAFRDLGEGWKTNILPFAIPPALELLGTIVYIVAVRLTSPLSLQALMVLHIPAIAIGQHLWIQRQQNICAWGALGWLLIGLLVTKLPPGSRPFTEWLVALFFALIIGFCLAGSSILKERLLKGGDFWESQVRLYLWGTFFSIVSYVPTTLLYPLHEYVYEQKEQQPITLIYIFTLIILAAMTAALELLVAVILRRRNNLALMVAVSTSLITSTSLMNYGSRFLRDQRETSWSLLGYILAGTSVWLFTRYKSVPGDNSDVARTTYYAPIPPHEEADTGPAGEQVEECKGCEMAEANPPKQLGSLATSPTNSLGTMAYTIFYAITFGQSRKTSFPGVHSVGLTSWRIALLLIPSFIQVGERAKVKKVHSTEYLDGLRGFAAFFVLLYHGLSRWHNYLTYGWNGTTEMHLIQLPWIRLIVSGNSMVAIFFVVSGFSLSVGPLRRISSNDLDGFVFSLASSVWRRWVRLFMPCAVLTFIVMLQIHIGADQGRLVREGGPSSLPLGAQLRHWLGDFVRISNPFNNIDLDSPLNNMSSFAATLWTIPLEFRGSMVVYLVLLGCAKMQERSRLIFIGGLTIFCIYCVHWDLALFLGGVFIADLHQRREDTIISSTPIILRGLIILFEGENAVIGARWRIIGPVLTSTFWILNFLFATYLLCTPSRFRFPRGQGDPGYIFIGSLIPNSYYESPAWDRFWPMIGGIYLVFTIDNCKILQSMFTFRFPKYLGWVSFSLYLVHLPFQNTFAEMMLQKLWVLSKSPLEDFYQTGYFWTGYLLSMLGIFWAADLFAMVFDEPSVQFSKWLYVKFLDEEARD